MSGFKPITELQSQFLPFVTKPIPVKCRQIREGDKIEYISKGVAKLITQRGSIEFSFSIPIALGDYLVTVHESPFAMHMDKHIFQRCYAPQGEHVSTAINESAAKELIEQANVLDRLPVLNHTTRKEQIKVANTLKSVAFLLRNGEKPL